VGVRAGTYNVADVDQVGKLFLGTPDHEVDERAQLR
jgi:hypothetical protein